jgi:hypothetical protein
MDTQLFSLNDWFAIFPDLHNPVIVAHLRGKPRFAFGDAFGTTSQVPKMGCGLMIPRGPERLLDDKAGNKDLRHRVRLPADVIGVVSLWHAWNIYQNVRTKKGNRMKSQFEGADNKEAFSAGSEQLRRCL